MTPDLATSCGEVVFPDTGVVAEKFKLSPGVAFHWINNQWVLEKVTPGAIRSCEDSFTTVMIQGRPCAAFDVLGQRQYAQPINEHMTLAQERKIKREARAERAKAPPPTPPPPAASAPTEPSPGPSKAAARLARMRAKFK